MKPQLAHLFAAFFDDDEFLVELALLVVALLLLPRLRLGAIVVERLDVLFVSYFA